MSTGETIIRVGHSPDSDDAFMFYALTHDRIDTGGLRFVHQLEDIETLNRRALEGELEVSAVSIHAFAYLADRYALLASGASMGERYGPNLVTREPATVEDLRGRTIAIPGKLTSAYLALQLCLGKDVPVVVKPFDQILPAVAKGEVDAGTNLPDQPDDCRKKESHAELLAGAEVRSILIRERAALDRQNARTDRCTEFYDDVKQRFKKR